MFSVVIVTSAQASFIYCLLPLCHTTCYCRYKRFIEEILHRCAWNMNDSVPVMGIKRQGRVGVKHCWLQSKWRHWDVLWDQERLQVTQRSGKHWTESWLYQGHGRCRSNRGVIQLYLALNLLYPQEYNPEWQKSLNDVWIFFFFFFFPLSKIQQIRQCTRVQACNIP